MTSFLLLCWGSSGRGGRGGRRPGGATTTTTKLLRFRRFRRRRSRRSKGSTFSASRPPSAAGGRAAALVVLLLLRPSRRTSGVCSRMLGAPGVSWRSAWASWPVPFFVLWKKKKTRDEVEFVDFFFSKEKGKKKLATVCRMSNFLSLSPIPHPLVLPHSLPKNSPR